ncbi:adp-dependent glucokinase-like [Plasmopara halstedii]|uniref:Adp-dependent glucokinase-like n=1 Tax=Plasmopara halstedii TaxID=4781 RepID=A0A0N7L7T4_PLAHL|nr:adp-dependent glucokinase-like [Plasmopara halstedii]CEG47963.1 adp-dependent glucokinase-like [Plasmopara halstedii]|eukprot:XP_024584332.1 adp-dependent glucokinase-like [Plasmopara halstedii]
MYSASQLLALSVSVAICVIAVLYADYFAGLFSKRDASFSVPEQQQMLASLMFHASKNGNAAANTRDPPRLAFCCSADLDVAVPAVALMQSVQKVELQQLQKNSKNEKIDEKLNKTHHERIGSLKQLQESFVYYFSTGAAAEQSTLSPEQFREVVTLANALPEVKRKVGGNAATMAERASAEGCMVLLGAAMGNGMKPYFVDERIKLVGHLKEHEHEDVHLVLEYASGDKFRGYTSPRANRYYLNHDVHNAQLSVLEEFEKSLDSFKPDLVVFGGLQLMEVQINEATRLMRLQALSDVLQNLFVTQTPTHYEFAAVSDFTLFDDTVRLVLPWVDSIGLNEQELFILHHFLVTGEKGTATTSRPSVSEISAQLHDIIQFASKAKKVFQTTKEDRDKSVALAQLSRIHFHTLQFHIVCQKMGSKWEDPTTALVQSALMSSKVACGKSRANTTDESIPQPMRTSAEMEVDPTRIEMLLARQQLLSERQNLKVELDPFSPIVTWQEANFQCHLVPMLACKKPDHTAGLGDNISGTGVAYHRIQK